MLTQRIVPECLTETIAPNEEMRKCWEELIGVDDRKRQLLTHMTICLSPSSLLSWHQRHYRGDFREPRYRRRVLLVGPPGTGKTLMARGCVDCYARVMKTKVYFEELGLVRGKYVGESSRNIQRAFQYLTDLTQDSKVVLFIDEFDSVGPSRKTEQMHDDVRAMVNTLIAEMNKLSTTNLFTIAASNFEGYIDHAVKRRFDFILYFSRPSFEQRAELLKHFLEPYDISLKDITTLVKKTEGHTQDDIIRLVNRAIEEAYSQDQQLVASHLILATSATRPTGDY